MADLIAIGYPDEDEKELQDALHGDHSAAQ